MQFDFTLTPYAAQKLDVRGKFFKLVRATGTVRVRTDTGENLDLLPGQGVWNTSFNWLTIADRTGANNTGALLAGDYDFRDDRISGTVDVVDGGKARTLANQSFLVTTLSPAAANVYSACQLWNPAGSGKNVVVEQLICSTSGLAANGICVRFNTAALVAQPASPGTSKKAIPNGGTGVTSVGVAAVEQVSPVTATTGATFLIINAAQKSYKPTEPIILPPGTGMYVFNLTANENLTASFEWFEESI